MPPPGREDVSVVVVRPGARSPELLAVVFVCGLWRRCDEAAHELISGSARTGRGDERDASRGESRSGGKWERFRQGAGSAMHAWDPCNAPRSVLCRIERYRQIRIITILRRPPSITCTSQHTSYAGGIVITLQQFSMEPTKEHIFTTTTQTSQEPKIQYKDPK